MLAIAFLLPYNVGKEVSKMQISAAVFDLDGTLIDSLIFWNVLWEKLGQVFLHREGFRPTLADDKAVRTMPLRKAMGLIHRNYGIADSAEALADYTDRMIEDFYANQVALKPGAKAFLDHLKAKGVRMCIASATQTEFINMILRRFGLSQHFEAIFSCGAIGKGKDQPDVFLLAQQHFGTPMEETWLFEDSLVAIQTAVNLGMPTVAVYDPNNFGQEQMRFLARHYIGPGETLEKLIREEWLCSPSG